MAAMEPSLRDAREERDRSELRGLDRVLVRTRESAVTLSAWSLALVTAAGNGTIRRIDAPSGASLYRGDGICLGWTQSELEAAYRRAVPEPPSPEPDAGQLG